MAIAVLVLTSPACKESTSDAQNESEMALVPPMESKEKMAILSQSGSIYCSTESRIIEFDLANSRICAEWGFDAQIKYAVPILSRKQFIIVEQKKDSGAYQLVRYDASNRARHPIGTYKNIGLPAIADDETLVACVVEHDETGFALIWADIDARGEWEQLGGRYKIDNVGPCWGTDTRNRRTILLATQDGYIVEVSIEDRVLRKIIKADYAQLDLERNKIYCIRHDELLECDGLGDNLKLVAKIGYIAPFYRAFKLGPNGRQAIVKTLGFMDGFPGAQKALPGLVVVDLATGTKSWLDVGIDVAGPWAWVAKADRIPEAPLGRVSDRE